MNNNLLIPQVGGSRPVDPATSRQASEAKPQKGEFDQLLKSQVEGAVRTAPAPATQALKFSNHALERLRERGIKMDQAEAARLEKAVDSAANKGSREALVLTKDAAFIVSVANKTVITALDRGAAEGNVFTNIDSTVVI